MNRLIIKKGTVAQLIAAASASQLTAGELYFTTDEVKVYIGTSTASYAIISPSAPAVQTVSSGSSVTIADNASLLKVNPADLLASLAITLPTASYAQGSVLNITFGGNIAVFGQVVTTLSIVAPSGTTIDTASLTPIGAISGDSLGYALVGTVWTRIQ